MKNLKLLYSKLNAELRCVLLQFKYSTNLSVRYRFINCNGFWEYDIIDEFGNNYE